MSSYQIEFNSNKFCRVLCYSSVSFYFIFGVANPLTCVLNCSPRKVGFLKQKVLITPNCCPGILLWPLGPP
ncbi:hypothetical protein XELAEV_18044619mg [Xenopus laevis]|uniref:Uncharacterized protein n=1 Tax=Xenopus laevis TaxID=8355 RepID=A0A974BZ52_XENLA|nr:hypothetical protein XELAEV_18044619mg [Xenopus laevis]